MINSIFGVLPQKIYLIEANNSNSYKSFMFSISLLMQNFVRKQNRKPTPIEKCNVPNAHQVACGNMLNSQIQHQVTYGKLNICSFLFFGLNFSNLNEML